VKDKLLKYPIIETIIAILWLYPFGNFINTFLHEIAFYICVYCLYFLNFLSDWINHENTVEELAKATGITASFLSYPIEFTIKILILILFIFLFQKIKLKCLNND